MQSTRPIETLEQWLENINHYYPKEIELGLSRILPVAKALNLLYLPFPTITVGGTNGKGSTVKGLEAIYMAEGYKVGAFTSPKKLDIIKRTKKDKKIYELY